MIASGEDSPEALSGFVKFHPQYPVLKVPGGASRPPCASRSRLARGCILRASPPRVKGKFGFGRIYCGARADSAEPSGFSQLMQSLPRGPCRPSLWRSLHNLPSTAQSFRDSRDRSFAFHGASSAAWAKAPAVPLDWPISVAASAIDQGRPTGRWPACRPSHRSGAAAPPDAWVGLAAGPAEAGGRPPMGEPLLRGPAGGLDGGVVARAAPAGEGPPDIERLQQAADAGVRELAAAESESAPIPSTAFAPPSGGCLPWANRPLRTRRGRGGQAPNASPPCLGLPRCARTGPARPPRARGGRARAPRPRDAHARRGRAFAPGRLNGAGESGRTRKGRRPAPTPLNETHFLSYKPFPSYGPEKQKKRGPPSPAGPSGIRGGA